MPPTKRAIGLLKIRQDTESGWIRAASPGGLLKAMASIPLGVKKSLAIVSMRP
jgi:hypothetical protein